MNTTRRRFLTASALVAGGAVVAGGGVMVARFKNMSLFDLYIESSQKVLAARFGDDQAEVIVADALAEYEALLPEVPSIGGAENLNAENLLVSAYCLAEYRVLRARSQTVQGVGRIVYEAYEEATDLPAWLRAPVGRLKYGKKSQEVWREQAARSQKRQYPGDWVFTFVEGDGEAFDYGLDFTECGICKLYHAQGADELTPYLCLVDEVVSKAFGRGLVRHRTLAEGTETCDFRYKRGRETYVRPLRDGWPPQFDDQIG